MQRMNETLRRYRLALLASLTVVPLAAALGQPAAPGPYLNLGAISSPQAGRQVVYGYSQTNNELLPISVDAFGEVWIANPGSGGGGGGSGGAVTESGTWNVGLLYGGSVVSSSNLFGVTDAALDALISGSKLPVSGTFWQATQPVSIATLPLPSGAATNAAIAATNAPVAPAAATATFSTLMGCLANTTLPAFTAGQQGAVPCDTSGRPYVNIGADSLGNVPTYLQAVSSGGATAAGYINAASSCMATNVKSGTGQLFTFSVSNNGSSAVFVNIFASATAPTCGSGTPLYHSIYVPATSTVSVPFPSDLGAVINNGISFDVVTAAGDTAAGTITAANTVSVSLSYK